REPTHEELAGETGLSVERVGAVLEHAEASVSLNAPVGEERDAELGDLIADDATVDPVDAVDGTLRHESVRRAVGDLPELHRAVIELRFGLGGATPASLDEIARRLSISRAHVRVVEAEALERLGLALGEIDEPAEAAWNEPERPHVDPCGPGGLVVCSRGDRRLDRIDLGRLVRTG